MSVRRLKKGLFLKLDSLGSVRQKVGECPQDRAEEWNREEHQEENDLEAVEDNERYVVVFQPAAKRRNLLGNDRHDDHFDRVERPILFVEAREDIADRDQNAESVGVDFEENFNAHRILC